MPQIETNYLSDEEILQIGLHFGDPRAGFDLLSPKLIPEVPKWIKLVAKYKCKDAVKCMKPACGQPHNEGAVVEIKLINQGTGLINIGHDCGALLFPEEYVAGATRYDTDLERKKLIVRKRNILSGAQKIERWFEIVRRPFEEYDSARREFEAFFPDLLDEIRSANSSRDGDMVIQETSGKIFKEALAAEGVRSRFDSGWRVVHRVQGRHFFSKGELVERVVRVANECGQLIERLRPDNLSVAEMRECLDRLQRIGEKLEGMVWQRKDMFAALSAENLFGLAKWSRMANQDSPYEFRDNGLLRHRDGRLPEYFLKLGVDLEPNPIERFPISQAA